MELIDLKKEIGKKIRAARGNLTQEAFGEIVGIDKQQISRYERGENLPRLETLNKIAEYTNTPPDFFKVSDQTPIWEIETTEQKKLLSKVKKILESGNDKAVDALKANIEAFFEMACGVKNNNENKGGE